MPGNRPPYNFSRLLIALLPVLLVLQMVCSRPASAKADGPIAILLSDSGEAYQQQAEAFSDDVGKPCQVFNLQGDIQRDPTLKNSLMDRNPSLIYALGAKAAYAAKLWTKDRQDLPVIFAMVLNWQRYNLLEGQSNIAGISAEVAPGTQFANMTMISPTVKRVGLLYSPHSITLLAQAKKQAALLGLELVAEAIARSDEFALGFKRLTGQVDAFWVLNDPVIYTLENLDWLENRCMKDKLFCVGQSQNLAKTGMLLTVNPDLSQIAAQAAAMAQNILARGMKPADLQVMEPLGTQLLINLKTAAHIGVTLSPQALSLATTVVRP